MTIEKELPKVSVAGANLDKETVSYPPEAKSAVDSLVNREGVLTGRLTEMETELTRVNAELTATKESLENSKKAADKMVTKDDLYALADELVDARETVGKIGLDQAQMEGLTGEKDPIKIKAAVVEKLLPDAYKQLSDQNQLDNKTAVDAMYIAAKSNLQFNKDVAETRDLLTGTHPASRQAADRKPPVTSVPNIHEMSTAMRIYQGR